ncbi:hypothetical protein DEU56DRAFT_753030 [Suillus clintonianus]|uniref:uncharacterized protein n=1 Tax=Suillus clintonianus TaxID=1904413 RepID=UPI001B8834D1|nr:uncharacterized protein DEU56DRAFT_753030 [Suillus clintonianus]KAG2148784.1 hypothetical protein DEU56DRAFT_753030 [Suillus clintonianus]
MSTLPDGNYMIEFANPIWKGWFVSVDEPRNMGVELCQKDSSKVQVWKLVDMGDGCRSFQGVSPKVDGEKLICANNDLTGIQESLYLFYGDEPSMWHVFRLESVTGSQDTFRMYLKFGSVKLYWCTQGGALRMMNDSTPDDIEWKFTKM